MGCRHEKLDGEEAYLIQTDDNEPKEHQCQCLKGLIVLSFQSGIKIYHPLVFEGRRGPLCCCYYFLKDSNLCTERNRTRYIQS